MVRILNQQLPDDSFTIVQPSDIFYADDGSLFGCDANTVQQMVDKSGCLFQMIGLHPNANKTKFMVTIPKPFRSGLSVRTYSNVTQKAAEVNREFPRLLIKCNICGTDIQRQNMIQHMRFVHLIHDYSLPKYDEDVKVQELTGSTWEINKKQTSFPRPDCKYKCQTNTTLRYHMNRMHPKDFLQGNEYDLVRCTIFGVFIRPETTSMISHQHTKIFKEMKDRNDRIIENKSNKHAIRTVMTIEDEPIERVSEFRYLGRMIADSNDDWLAILTNIKKYRIRWGRLAKVLRSYTIPHKLASVFYKVVIMTVLLYGRDTWVITGTMRLKLRSFHHSVERSLSPLKGKLDEQSGIFRLPHIKEVRESLDLKTIDEYISDRRLTLMRTVNEEDYDKSRLTK